MFCLSQPALGRVFCLNWGMEVNTGRNLLSFPHCGRVFLCSDVLGITDIRLATDAYQFVMENGIPFVNSVGSPSNWGNVYSIGNQLGNLSEQAVTGITDGFQCLVANGQYSTEAVGEIRGDCDGYALDISFRMLTGGEFQAFGNYGQSDGRGYRAQRIRITLQNQAAAPANSSYVLLDIFADYSYYSANVATLPALSNAVNTIDIATNPRGLAIGTINNATVFGTLPATILRANLACQASCFVRYEMPLDSFGNTWTAPPASVNAFGNIYVTANFDRVENQMIGDFDETGNASAGVLSVNLATFWTGLGTVPTGVAGGTGGTRSITAFANQTAQPLLPMGGEVDLAQAFNLRNRGNSAVGASWPCMSIISHNFGGALKPICGNGGTYKETDAGTHTMTHYVQCPHGSTNFVLIAKVRTIDIVGSTHTVDFLLTNSDSTASQTISTTTNVGNNTGYRYIYVNGSLNLNMRPIGQLVERYTLRMRAIKSAPRSVQINEPYLADGILAVYLAFYQ